MEPMVVMAARAAQTVGQELLKAHQNRHKLDLQVEEKGIDGPVTRVDRYLEQLTIDTLRKSYKNHSFLGEEFGYQEGKGHDADWCWIIDPLDGTLNFINGVPHFCISIAVQHKGITQHGVIYDPVKDELFSASRGRGAMMNQRRIRVNVKDSLENTFMSVGHAYRAKRNGEVISYAKNHFASLLNVTEAGAQYRRTGSAALDLAYVAAGRFDAYFELGLKPWDIAAGELIVKEAGGTVVDARGGSDSMENGQVLACSMKMLKPLMQAVVPAWGEAAK
ncbi:inositol monophosphatase family protein [Acinetobacter tandoii]|jgi:myo-inositol-1(or 4)-monophosphatase|uniref:Inositol-1-monophosphatase n=2 Tax=Acinetobacter tandoii TaxID=202954 RepID=R9AQN2_9GAMM|nr:MULTISPECIES: inositol monophosphatase family protein [Acinetobacter]AUX86094.1 inositol monophosphatase [Acinetobacter sp. ACNIH2]EOR02386.1 myo-inositol-1(or 4)-monophosphatase [Acinetobacter tandoii DSM 14970 = CIP 107469]KAB1856635.1 inositol monophosphatase [Acinetobacter tandoii]UOG17904.1 inositol monophosphatase [Acinetobacter sp. PK01]